MDIYKYIQESLCTVCFKFMNVKDLSSLIQTCKRMKKRLNSDYVWKYLCFRDFYITNIIEKDDPKLIYISNYIKMYKMRDYQQNVCSMFQGKIESDFLDLTKDKEEEHFVISKHSKSGLLCMDMRTGKTLTSLGISFEINKTSLIICPKSLIGTWEREMKKFYSNKIKYLILHKDFINDNDNIDFNKYHFIITTYERVSFEYSKLNEKNIIASTTGRYGTILPNKYSFNTIPKKSKIHNIIKLGNNKKSKLYNFKWNYILLDEAHRIKNTRSISFISCFSLKSFHYLALTGTPIINKKSDEIALKLFSLGKFDPTSEEISKIIIAKVSREEVPELACIKTNIKNVYVNLSENQKQLYNKELMDLKHNITIGNSGNALKCISQLRQICISLYILKNNSNFKTKNDFINSPKINSVLNLIKEIKQRKEKVIVFSNFNDNLIAFQKLLGGILLVGKTSSQERLDINKSLLKEDFIFSNFRVAGVGLNLIEINNVIVLEPWWNLPLEDQAIARVLGIGQEKIVNVYNIIAEKTIEFYMLNIKTNKLQLYENKSHQQGLLQNIKTIFNEYNEYDLLLN